MRTPLLAPPRPRTRLRAAPSFLWLPAWPPQHKPTAWPPACPPAAASPCALHACRPRVRAPNAEPEPEPEPEPAPEAAQLLLADLLHSHGQDVDRPRLRREDHREDQDPEAQEGRPPVEGPERRLRRPVRLPGDPGAHHHHAGGRGQHHAARQEDGRHLRGARPLEEDERGRDRRPYPYDQGRGAPLRQENEPGAPTPPTHPPPRAAPRDDRCDRPRARRRTRCSRR